MRKQLKTVALSLAMALALAASLSAADCRNRIALAATSDGAAIGASGTAEIRARGTQQRFKVSVDADVADGTTFAVYANGQLAGTITIALGQGELDLNSNNGPLPTAVDPVCGIRAVSVVDGNGVAILQGSF